MEACNEDERDLIHADRPPGYRSSASHGHGLPPLMALLGSVTLWALCAASCFVSFGWYFYITWQPQFLKDVHAIDYSSSEVLTGLPLLFGALGCLVGGKVSDILVQRTGSRRWGRSLVGAVGFALAGLCVLGSGFAAEAWQTVALLCLASLFNDLAIPIIWTVCADVGGRFAGTVAGIMNMAGGVGAVLSPMLIPVVLGFLPPSFTAPERWQTVFAGLALAWFLGAIAWLLIDSSRPLFEETPFVLPASPPPEAIFHKNAPAGRFPSPVEGIQRPDEGTKAGPPA
jgi:MFS family permease